MINKKRLIRLTQQLIRIDSQNPPGDESQIASFVGNFLEGLGLSTKIYEFRERRSNIVAFLGKKDQKYSLLISPHLDTVPCGQNWHFNPFSGRVYKGKIYGLGATDCKGNLACALEAINSIVEDNIILGYNLIFAATAEEESGSTLGLIPLLDKGKLDPDVAVILDSDDFDIIVAQKGLIHLKVKIKGKKAHGAYPWLGINAIEIAVGILNELKTYQLSLKKYSFQDDALRSKNKYLRPPTLNIGTIKGGDKVNVVADWCEFELDCRFLPGMSDKKILKDIRAIIRRHSNKFKIEIEGIQEPYYINKDHPLIDCLSRAMQKIKVKPRITGSEGATTITFFQNKLIPAIATGFGSQGCAHAIDEYAKIDNLYKGTKVLEEFLRTYRFNYKTQYKR